jgi:hypothetical protein
MNEWIVELKVKFEIWRSRGECKECDLPMSEKVILDIERTPSRALIGVLAVLVAVDPLSHSAIQKGHTGHGNQCSPCPQCPPPIKTLAVGPIPSALK